MSKRTFLSFISSLLLTVLAGNSNVTAMPSSTTDETKVPHYFGPNPNWANSPLTLPKAEVVITGGNGDATATATVGADGYNTGIITGINVTNGGTGYTKKNTTIKIKGPGGLAKARAVIVDKGAIVDIKVTNGGTGYYMTPILKISGCGAGTGCATASAYGGVEDNIPVTNGAGYTFPTVDFDLPDGPNGVQATGHVEKDPNTGDITKVIVDNPGSGYSIAPDITIRDGTIFDPVPGGGSGAAATATLFINSVVIDNPGANYTSPPTVTTDPLESGGGSGATFEAKIANGVIAAIDVINPGLGYITPGGLKKFINTLPGLGSDAANSLGQYIPVAVPDTTTFPDADYYEIGVIQYRHQFHTGLPATLYRGYVQLSTSVVQGNPSVSLSNANLDGTLTSTGYFGVTEPHYLGPTIVARKDRPVRITFRNLLPTGTAGDLFLPVDSTMMGAGMGPMMGMMAPADNGTVDDKVRNPKCTEYKDTSGNPVGKSDMCFKDNRAVLHLHGGNTPWISDGTPHQWITPADETGAGVTDMTGKFPKGVSVQDVPDMWFDSTGALITSCAGQTTCTVAGATNNPGAGAQTYYYTNQQSARLLYYHDHSWGITRLNVYAGEAAGYIITDDTEKKLLPSTADNPTGLGLIPGAADTIPLVIQDKTFVPKDKQLYNQYDQNGNVISYGQDPTWDKARWGRHGDLWLHHVYMPAQNPGDPSGMSSFGRWMYGPWFWPPATPPHGPITNPYYNMDPKANPPFSQPLATPCSLDNPATWQYQSAPFCEPKLIPGTPNISAGMEQFNDTPIVNGTAYPTVTLDPKAYRFRLLNASNDRFFNLQWYEADSTGTEVALNAAEVEIAQIDPNVFPTPDTKVSPVGPSWIQIGTEAGFLPAPVVVPNQPITWITDPTRFDFGNVDKHAMLIAPAERADVIVDFSKFAGKTLILYNDAPAAFPARVPSYDYYTGHPDLGAGTTLPGYGPNTRTIMKVTITNNSSMPFNLSKLQAAFNHKAKGTGVFESSQHPIIVGQAAYNSAYGTSFTAKGDCSDANGTNKCDGFARINQQGRDLFRFDTLKGPQLKIPLEPKALHDEMNAAAFDEFGRMTANLGLEAVPATPALQNILLYPYTAPMTELIDATKLPKPAIGVKVTPIASNDDGTQIWKITHNGVDTHPIHFHAYDVQLLNRVTWDNIIMPPDATERGWKDTVRVSPLEDTIVALRPVIPYVPFDLPNSIRLLNPMMLERDEIIGPTRVFDPTGNPVNSIPNHYVNFGAEYVYHCHILSHEEMDMMRPVSIALPPKAPILLSFDTTTKTLSWTDNSLSETGFVVEKSKDGGNTWTQVGQQIVRNLADPNTTPNTTGGRESITDASWEGGDKYRVVAQNTVGDIGTLGFPTMTVTSVSEVITPVVTPPAP